MKPERVFRLDEIDQKLGTSLQVLRVCQSTVGRQLGFCGPELADELRQSIKRDTAYLKCSILNGLDPCLQLRLRPAVTGLAGIADVKHRALHMMVRQLHRADPL